MTPQEFALHYHRLKFRLACYEKKGVAFQSFFERIMKKYDATFVAVKPSGQDGDWKCDGFSQGDGTVYQCYAPEGLTVIETVNKIKADFGGALKIWKDRMRRWVFVWSHHEALPARVLDVLQQLHKENQQVDVDNWSQEKLWGFIQAFPLQDRIDLLGAVPELSAVADTTAAEVQSLLNYLVRAHPVVSDSTDLELTDLRDKIERNRLGVGVQTQISMAIPVARVAEEYINGHPDLDFSALVAQSLALKYRTLSREGGSPDTVFIGLVTYVAQGSTDSRTYWAAVGIVTHYFQLCEVFER